MQTSHGENVPRGKKSPEGESPQREKVPRGRPPELPTGKMSPEGKSPLREKVPGGKSPQRTSPGKSGKSEADETDETDEKEPNKFVHTKENHANFPRGKCPLREKVP